MINRKRAKRQADGQQKKDKKTDRWSTEKDKQWSTKHYTENQRSGNMTPTKTDVNSEAQKPKIWQHDIH